ncbi:hypothetical protein NESM_000710400 [Novymonas esmeraldas]|uniref:Uncharacterized protein n=1 Tax=Novymonas esmeraldas TaxID=1808958 RepID=A0AAW0EXR6_9TRYP
MQSPPVQTVSGEQRARLLELEERQRQLKRLCEEALKEEEQHQHMFQQLEERHTIASSSVGSFAGAGGGGIFSASAALRGRAGASTAGAEPLDDLLTGEVHSFRDPNSIARASSTGSVVAAPGQRGGSLHNQRTNTLNDPPRTQPDSGYRPPTYPPPPPPPPATATTSAAAASAAQPPPIPPRTMLYSVSRQPRTEAGRPALASQTRPPPPPAPAPPPPVPQSWRQEQTDTGSETPGARATYDSARVGAGYGTYAASRPARPTPPSAPAPSPERPRSRSASHGGSPADRYRRSPTYSHHGIPPPPPPPPPPPSTSGTAATVSPTSVRYSRSLGTRAGLIPPATASPAHSPPPPRPSAPPLISPDAVAEPRSSRTRRGYFNDAPPLPRPPPPPPPPRASTDATDGGGGGGGGGGDSALSTTSTERDIARWRRRLLDSEIGGAGRGGASWEERRVRRSTAAAAPPSAVHRESAAASWRATVTRASPQPPPPPPPPPTALSPPARYDVSREDDDELLLSRWETASLTPSLRSAEERHLRHYFSKSNDKSGGISAPVRREYAGRAHQRAPPTRSGAPLSPAPAPHSSARAAEATPPAAPPPPPRPAAAPPPTADGPPKQRRHTPAVHPYSVGQAQPAPLSSPPPPQSLRSVPSASLASALYARHQRTASGGLHSSRESIWGDDGVSVPAPSDAGGAAGAPVPHVTAATREFFDLGPEKEALLTLLRESAGRTVGGQTPRTISRASSQQPGWPKVETQPPHHHPPPSVSHLAVPHPSSPATQHTDPSHPTDAFVAPGPGTTASNAVPPPPQHGHDAQLQQRCDEAQAKAEALARHLVKAIGDRKALQGSVEQLEELVEECNAEVGRLQRVVEAQHRDSAASTGVQAALRAKEREVAVYEDEIRRLNEVLDSHLTRSAVAEQSALGSAQHGLAVREAEVEAAMAEVGMAHVAQREAEERAGQLANELETAVEQIQFLDERLAEMERAAAAARFQTTPARIAAGGHNTGAGDSNDADGLDEAAITLSSAAAAAHLAVPPTAEMRHWPLDARRAVAQLVAQAEGLLLQNAEGARHASMRLQHVEHTCSELQRHLGQRSEEAERAREACEQLRQEKCALRAAGELWHRQLCEVKADAQLVSEMMRTAREDAEDVYLSSRVAEARVEEQRAAAAAASPLQPRRLSPAPPPTDPATLKKAAHFAQQVMRDFHAVARFLSSLRTMDIGDRNGYQILQHIASGSHPAEGLYITADDAATPERLSTHVASEAKRRVLEKKARVLRAVEQALTIESAPAPAAATASHDAHNGHPAPRATVVLGLPPRAGERVPLGVVEVAVAEADVCEVPDAFDDEMASVDEAEVEVVASSIHPARMGSHSLRDGSNGMVHSDVRRRPPSDSTASLPRSRGAPTAPASETRGVASAGHATSLSPAPAAPVARTRCTVLPADKGDVPRATTAAQPTVATTAPPPPTPPPSVSRPLRLSTTPSQPQSDSKEADDRDNCTVAGAAATRASGQESSPPRAPSPTVLTTASSTPLRGEADMHSITVVSSTSTSQQQQQQLLLPQTAPPLQLARSAPPSSPPTAYTVPGISSSVLSVSDIAATDHDGVEPSTHGEDGDAPPHPQQPQQQQKQQQSETLRTASPPPPPPSRLRSPTPDRPPPPTQQREVTAHAPLATSPTERPRHSQSSADEPPPRVVRDEERPTAHAGSHPKDRSTTARPPSVPPLPTAATHADRHRRVPSSDSSNGEATLLFREPPRGEVREAGASSTLAPSQQQQHSRVAVDLLSDDFILPSRRPAGTTATAAAPSSYVMEDEEAVLEERVPGVDAGAAATAARPSLRTDSRTGGSRAATMAPPDAAARPAEESRSSSRGRRVVDDDDEEPSLGFLAPPPPLPPPVRSTSLPRRIRAASDDGDSSRHASPAEASLSSAGRLRVSVGLGGAVDNATHSPSSLGSSFAGAVQRSVHQPRRPGASDSGPSLSSAMAESVAPPRLQRSTAATSSTAAHSLLGTPAPGPAAATHPAVAPSPVAAAAAAAAAAAGSASGGRHPMSVTSVDRSLPDTTPALAEPRRSLPSARPDAAAAPHTVPVSTNSNVFGAAAAAEDQQQTATPRSESAAVSSAEPCDPVHVVSEELARSASKTSANTASSTPARRLPSITSTVAPGSPSRLLDEPTAGLGLPGETRTDVPGLTDAAVSLPAEPVQSAPQQTREPPSRAGSGAAQLSGAGPRDTPAPAALPTVNVDVPGSNTLGLRRNSSQPASISASAGVDGTSRSASSPVAAHTPSAAASTPRGRSGGARDGAQSIRSSTPTESPLSDEAAAKRREDVAKILERIRAKKEQDQLLAKSPGTGSLTSATLSRHSSAKPEDAGSPAA